MSTKITRRELAKHFKSRFEDIAKLEAAVESDNNGENEKKIEDLSQEIAESVLSFDVRLKITVLLGFGGPSDGYDLYFSDNGDPLYGEYWYQWAGPKAVYDLSEAELNSVLRAYGLDDSDNVLQIVKSKMP